MSESPTHRDEVHLSATFDATSVARCREVVLAGHRGDHAAALAAWSDHDPAVRVAAVGALERTQRLTGALLEAALVDPAVAVRRRAALAAAGRDECGAALRALLHDDDPTVVEVAAFALGERTDGADAVAALSACARSHTDSLCRESAVAALGSIGHPDGLPAVLAACEDRAPVRRRAVIALAAFDGPEVTAALRARLDDRDLQVRQSAEDLLAIDAAED